ncbi:MAG: hypothetical protein LBR98_06680 [Syntrophomonadaceae bacterium]|jgi:hypothetical protein|nr:hypothetical protein [Syntrophomonadaceae bacterium]
MFDIGLKSGARVNIVNEPELYKVILRSDKPEAKTFSRWVTHKNGQYHSKNIKAQFTVCVTGVGKWNIAAMWFKVKIILNHALLTAALLIS